MIQTTTSLLFLVCISGLCIFQVSAAYVCTAANKVGCASCDKLAICDATSTPKESSCGTGKVCSESTGTGACYTLGAAEAATCTCGPKYPDYKADPFDPSKYLMCVSAGVQYPRSCAAGLIFDKTVKKCVTGPPTTTLPPISCDDIGFFAHGCNAYYACIPDSSDPPKPIQCAKGEVFDESTPGCVAEADVIARYTPFKCEATPVAQMDSVMCNAFHICMAAGAPVGEKICCNSTDLFDSTSMTCKPNSTDLVKSCPQVNKCVASKLSFNCSDTLTSPPSSSSISSVSTRSTSSTGSTSSTSSLSSISMSSTSMSSPSSTLSSASAGGSSIMSSTTTARTGPDCSKDGAFPYPGDCTKYYYCASGQYRVQTCPSKFLFDKVKHYCDAASSVVC